MTESTTRLHISPLTPALLDSVLAPSIRPLATDISFHNIATFPENDYGFVTLPSMEADKLKKKLNGSILKGRKFKVEAARADPKKTKTPAKVDSDKISEGVTSPEPTKTSSKRKSEDSVLDGYELPGDRRVKRGWTEPASAKKLKKQKKADKEASKTKLQPKSKYTEKAECLFKTKMPPNKTSEIASKKSKSKKAKAPNEVVVHEFAQTFTHPSFLKSTIGRKPVTAKFEEGKGWVDEDGNVQEEMASKKTTTADYHPGKKDGAKERATVKGKFRTKVVREEEKKPLDPEQTLSEEEEDSDWTSSSGSSESESSTSDSDSDDSSSSGASSLSDQEDKTMEAQVTIKSKVTKIDERNVEGNESTSESDGVQEASSQVDEENKPSASSQDAETTETKELHPLEALFKRTQTEKSIPESEKPTFSFFAGNDDDIEDEEEEPTPLLLEPLTPFSKQDRQIRGLRSGAPTPDTAAFNRRKFLLSTEAQETPSKPRGEASSQRHPEESDFVKWFWENRGDNNRAWKRRRREAAKEKRQRENRRKGLKGRG
ncbi:conserved hypothetical protein [Talaromyces stipitatus ATCC 10500]|uniref:Suppressor protein SRP40 n=1 Tax=Talaromyces stipitatus (strain ATCC 10500 / CBS 375.48 / QM 6759 / NRRL 1006) TaxID=441959 RepID=B8MC43_TALSN|nr:uncharacterized protein TSTA_122250 [Talaromyces stipitatus ATCC 10500]EED18489.1 conserved hypothetical protein [Talaromyces stipitatus ATCC 10500]